MSYATATTFTIEGVHASAVTIEVDVRDGLPSFTVIGVGDAAARELRERVRCALLNSGLQMPARRVTANVAPARHRSIHPGWDLPIACAILAADGQLPAETLRQWALWGTLGLDGTLDACRGTLAAAQRAAVDQVDGLIVASHSAHEAALADDVTVAGCETLNDVVAVLRTGHHAAHAPSLASPRSELPTSPDLADLLGNDAAVRAAVIAAAGGHNLLISGAPGSGPTMLARRVAGLMPPMRRDEAIEVARIQGIAGLRGTPDLTRRPIRAPHHSISTAALLGNDRSLGELTLAHRGVMVLEVEQYASSLLHAVAGAAQDACVQVTRGGRAFELPADTLIVATVTATEDRSASERARDACLLTPVLSRLCTIITATQRPAGDQPTQAMTTADAQQLVIVARDRQRARHEDSRLDATAKRAMYADQSAKAALGHAVRQGTVLTAGSAARVMHVARTIADLADRDNVAAADVTEALAITLPVAQPLAAPTR